MRELVLKRALSLRVYGDMASIAYTNEDWLAYLNSLSAEDLLDKYLELRWNCLTIERSLDDHRYC